jgi:hypothetical protein
LKPPITQHFQTLKHYARRGKKTTAFAAGRPLRVLRRARDSCGNPKQIEVADEEYGSYLRSLQDAPEVPPKLKMGETSEEIVERLKKRMEVFNNWSRWLLALGVCLLCVFSLLNLPSTAKKMESGDSNGRIYNVKAN